MYVSSCRTLVGAWIETFQPCFQLERERSRTLVGAWIETMLCTQIQKHTSSRTLVGAWIETSPSFLGTLNTMSHPCGCVD